MSAVSVHGVTQAYGAFRALDDVTLEVGDREFLTLLGPSGCGKTTLLRVIAGFIQPTAGTVALDGADVTRVPPHRRPVNMVFQRATLFPHLDVGGNVAFGLRVGGERPPRDEVDRRVTEALALVRLEGYERRRAHELSGGQMQRVALARALVKRPRVLLLDEPLSALDLKIRLEMEVELRRVHRETEATFIYVTHDQREALALSDRVAVFEEGRIVQINPPDEVYRRPSTPFVARFVGDANVIAVDVRDGHVVLGGRRLPVPDFADGPGWLIVRPEAVRLDAPEAGVPGRVVDLAFRGTGHAYQVEVQGLAEPFKVETADGGPVSAVGDEVGVVIPDFACRLLERS